MEMLRHFSAREFVALFTAVALPNTTEPVLTAVITGDPDADCRIRAIAEEGGYTRQPIAVSGLVIVNETVANGQLQPLAAQGWRLLEAAAERRGIALELVSGFRSIETQRSLFADRLQREGIRRLGRAFASTEIAAGSADRAIRAVLAGIAPPGYSKHHTGYALDLNDAESGLPFTRFGETAGYRWLSADNFAQAKSCGFVPSNPDGQPRLGPRPEPWELVWVGSEHLHVVTR
jgi:D-alanyl-D-alanine carboxypeptidase